MSTLLNSIAYKPSLKVAPDHLLIKNSVHREICKVSYSENNPTFSVSQRTIKIEGDQSKYNPLNVDSSGLTAQLYKDANEFSKTTAYNKDQIFKLSGRLFRVNADAKTYATASDFRDAIISGELTPIVSGLGADHVNSQPAKMAFNDISVRGQAVLRHSAITASGELIDDLGAFGGSWDKVLEQSLIKPTINDLDREVVFTAIGIASKRPAIDLLPKHYISALNLSSMIELERQRVFRETGRAADTFVMSSNVLALLLANGHCEPVQEVEIVETVIEGEDGAEETLTEENVYAVPNRFMTKSGILLMACDLFEPDNVINLDFDYFMAVAKVDDQEVGVSPLYLHHFLPDGDVVSLYEFTDSKSLHPSVRASMRYGLMVAPFYSDDQTKKVIYGDAPEYISSMNGKSPLVSFTPVNLDFTRVA